MKQLSKNARFSHVPFFLVLSLVLNISVYSQKPYNLQHSDPLLEPWRWKKFTELDKGAFKCMTEDNKGNLWFLLNHHTLMKYDGYYWTEFTIPDSLNPMTVYTKNSHYHIHSIDNCIYIKGRSVIIKFENDTFSSLLDISRYKKFRLFQLMKLSNGFVAAPSTHGLFLFGEKNIVYTSTDSKKKEIDKFCPGFAWKKPFDYRQNFEYKYLVKSSDGNIMLISNSSTSQVSLTCDKLNPLKFDKMVEGSFKAAEAPRAIWLPENEIWLGSYQGSIPFYKYKNNQWEEVSIADQFGGKDDMKSMLYASTGVMYIGGKGVIYAYKNNKWLKYSSPNIPFTSEYIELYETKSGQLWIAALGGEVYKVEHSDRTWQTFPNLAYQITDSKGKQWFIARDNKMVYNRDEKWYYYDTRDGVIETPLRIIELSDGTIVCVGSHNGKATMCKLVNNKWEHLSLPIGWGIQKNTVYEDSQKRLWLGSEKPLISNANAKAGFVVLKNTDFKALHFDTIYIVDGWRYRNPNIGVIETSNGQIITGAPRMGFFIQENNTKISFELFNEVKKLGISPTGKIWGGSQEYGMFVLKKHGSAYVQEFIPLQGNFLSKNILDFYIQNDSSIFVVTGKDITYYDGETWINSIFDNYFRFEDRGAQVKAEGKKLWINMVPADWTFRALNVPEEKKDFQSITYTLDTIPPITKVTFYDKVVDKSGNTLVTWNGLDFFNQTSKKDILFSFRLNGDKWTPYKNEMQHHFIGLKHGDYTLEVRAKDKNGNIDSSPEIIYFTVLPPVWMRLWFLVMIGIFLFTTLYLARNIIIRNKNLALKNLALKDKQEEILAQNEEIYQQAEELMTQADELSKQRDKLSETNKKVVRSLQQLETISDFGQKLTASLSIDSINEMMYNYVRNIIRFDAFGIGLLNENSQMIIYPNFMEEGNKIPVFHKSLNDENSLTSWCVINQKPIIIGNIETEYQKYVPNFNVTETQRSTNSRIHIPLTVKEKRIGVLVINSYKKNAYQKDDFMNMQTVASYIAIALDNAKAYEQINDKNRAINESINYAQSIQSAFMPTQEQLNQYVDSFVLFKPKDIVSGDFTWFSSIEKDPGKPLKAYLCVADCTGHGVPGALVSMVGNNLLDKYINEQRIGNPADVLDKVNEGFQVRLKQRQTRNNDGMDVALIYLEQLENHHHKNGSRETKNYKVVFAGAKNPLIVCRADSGKLEYIKGSRKSIGGLRANQSRQKYENVELQLQSGDMLYMFTDGIVDQHSLNRDRFSLDRLMNLLEGMATENTYEQYSLLEQELENHQQSERQTDDITVMGIKL